MLYEFNTMEARHPWAGEWDWIGYLACQARGLEAFAWRLWNTTLLAVWLYTLESQLFRLWIRPMISFCLFLSMHGPMPPHIC